MLNLLDAVVERLADLLETIGERVEAVSEAIFRRPKGGEFEALLTDLARAQSLTSMTRNSLVSLARVFSFAALAQEIASDPDCQRTPTTPPAASRSSAVTSVFSRVVRWPAFSWRRYIGNKAS